jgi:hypothetical protein
MLAMEDGHFELPAPHIIPVLPNLQFGSHEYKHL